jgi:hypothetical protein
MGGLILLGAAVDFRIGRENLRAKDEVIAGETSTSEFLPLEVEAGEWLREHTPPESIVMARHWPTVRHYAERKLIWFAPISDPAILLDGIRRHAVNYVVVAKHTSPYYLPDDDYCFDRLLELQPESFHLVYEVESLRIFSVQAR